MKLETFESDPHVYKREKRRTYKKNDGILCIINQKVGGRGGGGGGGGF